MSEFYQINLSDPDHWFTKLYYLNYWDLLSYLQQQVDKLPSNYILMTECFIFSFVAVQYIYVFIWAFYSWDFINFYWLYEYIEMFKIYGSRNFMYSVVRWPVDYIEAIVSDLYFRGAMKFNY